MKTAHYAASSVAARKVFLSSTTRHCCGPPASWNWMYQQKALTRTNARYVRWQPRVPLTSQVVRASWAEPVRSFTGVQPLNHPRCYSDWVDAISVRSLRYLSMSGTARWMKRDQSGPRINRYFRLPSGTSLGLRTVPKVPLGDGTR